MKLKQGDKVIIITGKDKGKEGKIIKTLKTEDKVIVEDAATSDKVSDGAELTPTRHSLRIVNPKFDGCVVIRTTGNQREILAFKAGEIVPFSVDPGDIASVCLARDSVWRVSVGKLEASPRRTHSVPRATSHIRAPFSHAMAGVLRRFPDAEAWRTGIRIAARRGWIDAEEFRQLKLESPSEQGERT